MSRIDEKSMAMKKTLFLKVEIALNVSDRDLYDYAL